MNVGDLVIAEYKSGRYVGELIQLDKPRAKVRMLAVVKHPTQGDLHAPGEADVPLFHERRALAYREVANVLVSQLEPYDFDEAPDYKASLLAAAQVEIEAMERLDNAFGRRSIEALEQLASEYGKLT